MHKAALKSSRKSVTKAEKSITKKSITKTKRVQKRTLTSKKKVAKKSIMTKSTTTLPKLSLSQTQSQLQLSPFTTQRANSAHPTSIREFESEFPTQATGSGLDYKLFFFPPGGNTDNISESISPWHDIPLIHSHHPNGKDIIFNFICEIPKGTVAKYELNTKNEKNPIKQDVKNGQLRTFKYGKIPFNYGALPQTWEDPKHIDSMMKLGGDNDPLDIVEISPGPLQHGVVYRVKIVGALALIDEGEVDWKLLAIDTNHPIAPKLQDIHHLDAFLPSFESKLKDWFKNYKTAEGKGQNQFGYNDKLLPKSKAIDIIQQCHESWIQLSSGNNHGDLAVPPLPEGFKPANLNH